MIATWIACMELQPAHRLGGGLAKRERGCGVARLGLKLIEVSLKGLPLRVMQWRKHRSAGEVRIWAHDRFSKCLTRARRSANPFAALSNATISTFSK